MLWGEQGVGDEILFASLIPELVKKVDELIVQVDPRLIPLFKRSFNKRIIYIQKNQILEELTMMELALEQYLMMQVI